MAANDSLTVPMSDIPIGSFEWEILGSQELEPAHKDRLYRFREALYNAQENMNVFDIERIETAVTDPKKSINSQMLEGIAYHTAKADDRFWLSPEFKWLKMAGLSAFDVIRSARAETSAHQVFFGLLHEGKGQDGKHIPVAIKPCTTKPMAACEDWLNGNLASSKEFDERCYEPIGFILSDGIGYSLTLLDRESETLDNSDWSNIFRVSEDDPAYKGQRGLLTDLAAHLAQLHRKGIYHGDPQFKNVSVDVRGELFFIDWESSSFYRHQEDSHEQIHKAAHDLKILFRSMAMSEEKMGVGLLDGFKYPVQWDFFKKYIFDPYIESYLDGADESGPEFSMVAAVEEQMSEYILEGSVYQSSRRQRDN